MGEWSNTDRRASIPVWKALPASKCSQSGGRARIVIVGAGPVGLALAVDLAQRGQDVILLGRYDFIPGGSKAICFSKRSLDILDRLEVGEAALHKGVTWNIGKVFWKDELIYQFDLLPMKQQKMPAFINLPQYELEELLVERAAGLPEIDLRWGHELTSIEAGAQGVEIGVGTAAGSYTIAADWIVACDGSRSTVRRLLGLDFAGEAFEDKFLIADVKMDDDRPSERWFWFDPPFNPGRTALLHKQPEGIWRIDFQLGPSADAAACLRPEVVERMVRAMVGPDVQFEPVWTSVYTFQCRRMDRFVHDRVIFAGDSAHLVSPFGARGCNGGLADAANLGWKLDLVARGTAGSELLDSYDAECRSAADCNILHSTRSTTFLSPPSSQARHFRDAALQLSGRADFARELVNSGRLAQAVPYPGSALNTPDCDAWADTGVPPGSPAVDAPLGGGWLLERLPRRFVLLCNGCGIAVPEDVVMIDVSRFAPSEVLAARYGLEPGTGYLIRPDQYVAARWKELSPAPLARALARATGAAQCV